MAAVGRARSAESGGQPLREGGPGRGEGRVPRPLGPGGGGGRLHLHGGEGRGVPVRRGKAGPVSLP